MIERFAAGPQDTAAGSMTLANPTPSAILQHGKIPVASSDIAQVPSIPESTIGNRVPGGLQQGDSTRKLKNISTVISAASAISGDAHSPTTHHYKPKIFPGIVHERHRRTSERRQGSGSETDGDGSMASSWVSDRKRPASSVIGDLPMNGAVLEEAAEDA